MNSQQDPPPRASEVRPDAEGSHQAALLIDFDNVTMGIRSNLGQELRNLLSSDVLRGTVAVQRAYADWRRYPQYIVPLSEASVDLIFAPAYGSSKKNATDIRLAIDALELVFTRPEIKTFILMSGDSDFSSLVLKLKEYGKYVIGVGIQESSSDLLVQNCDEYYSYSALSGLTKAGEEPRERHDPWVLVAKAVSKMVERGDTMRSDRLKQVMLEIDPTFNDKEHGFSRFNRFVVEAASQRLLSIQKMENGQYAVLPGARAAEVATEAGAAQVEAAKDQADGSGRRREKAEAKVESRRAGTRRGKDRTRERKEASDSKPPRGETRRARPRLTLKTGFELLDRALAGLLDGPDDSVRDSDVKRRLLEFDPDFDEGELGFSKFSKFLQEADEAGAIVLTRAPNGNYLVSRPSGARKKKRGRRGQERTRAPKKEPARTESSAEMPREPAVKRLARMLFGSGKETSTEPTSASQAPPAGKTPAEQPVAVAAETAEGKTKREGQRGPRSRDRRKPSRGRRSESGRPSGRGRGRTREGATRERAAPKGSSAARSPARQVKEAPVREKPLHVEAEAEKAPEVSQTEAAAVTQAPLPGAPRGTIRGRWGARGRYRPSQAPPPVLKGQTSAVGGQVASEVAPPDEEKPASKPQAKRAAPARPSKPAAIVSYLSTHYAGVGKRTAEMLVDEFGLDVFRVLDEEPDRVRQLLPGRRAEQVIAAHRESKSARSQ